MSGLESTVRLYPPSVYAIVGLSGSGKTSAMRVLLEHIINTYQTNPAEAQKILYTCMTSHTGRGYRRDDDPELIIDPRTGLPYRLFMLNEEIYKRADDIDRQRDEGKTEAFPILFYLDGKGTFVGNPYFRPSSDVNVALSLGFDVFYPTRSPSGQRQLESWKYTHTINFVTDDEVRRERKNIQRGEFEDPDRAINEIYFGGVFSERANSVIVTAPPRGIENPWQYSREEVARRLAQISIFGRRIPPEERKYRMHHHYVTETLRALGFEDGYENVEKHIGERVKLHNAEYTIEAKVVNAELDDVNKTVDITLQPLLPKSRMVDVTPQPLSRSYPPRDRNPRRRARVTDDVIENIRLDALLIHMRRSGFERIDPLHTYIHTQNASGENQTQIDPKKVTEVRYGLTDLTDLHEQYTGPQHTRITFT